MVAGANITITPSAGQYLITATPGAGGYATIQEEGTNLATQTTLNFVGSALTATNDAGNGRTNVSSHATVNSLASNTTVGMLSYTTTDTVSPVTITGTASRITVTNGTGASGGSPANPTIDISSSYAGQASITTLGTIGTGT